MVEEHFSDPRCVLHPSNCQSPFPNWLTQLPVEQVHPEVVSNMAGLRDNQFYIVGWLTEQECSCANNCTESTISELDSACLVQVYRTFSCYRHYYYIFIDVMCCCRHHWLVMFLHAFRLLLLLKIWLSHWKSLPSSYGGRAQHCIHVLPDQKIQMTMCGTLVYYAWLQDSVDYSCQLRTCSWMRQYMMCIWTVYIYCPYTHHIYGVSVWTYTFIIINASSSGYDLGHLQ